MTKREKIKNILSTMLAIILLIVLIVIYRKYDFNFYSKGITEVGKTSFERDSKETVGEERSYVIENKDFTSSLFYREISVRPNCAYKVSCMVKTENVEQDQSEGLSGAQIVLKNTEEHSTIIDGTTDWTKLEFCFNSKNHETAEIGFMLGGNFGKAKGKVWFSDLKIEQGYQSDDHQWNFACFIFKTTDVNLKNGIHVKEVLSDREAIELDTAIKKFQSTLSVLSKNKISANCQIMMISDPIHSLSYEEENGYYVSENDVYPIIQKYLIEDQYDHIFVCVKLPEEKEMGEDSATNWIGLGNMLYCGKGFSNIRIPTKESYEYSSVYNDFQQEVLLHEFLHTLERNAIEYGFEIPALHDNEKYGYFDEKTNRLKAWYRDYMNQEIKTKDGSYIGLPEEIFTYKPVKLSNFEYSTLLNDLDEPQNFLESLRCIWIQIKNVVQKETQEEQSVKVISD